MFKYIGIINTHMNREILGVEPLVGWINVGMLLVRDLILDAICG